MLLLFAKSTGGGAVTVPVPDVIGMDFTLAITTLTDVGLLGYANASAYSEVYALNQIISQSPAAGELVDPGSTVTLTISLGSGNLGAVKRMRFRAFSHKMRFKVL